MAAENTSPAKMSPEDADKMIESLMSCGIPSEKLRVIIESKTPSATKSQSQNPPSQSPPSKIDLSYFPSPIKSVPTATSTDVAMADDTLEEESSKKEDKGNYVAARVVKRKKTKAASTAKKSARTTRQTTPIHVDEEEDESEEAAEDTEGKKSSVVFELMLDDEFLLENKLEIIKDLLEFQGWSHLFEKPVYVDEKCVKEFYSEFELDEKEGDMVDAFIKIGGKVQRFNKREVANVLNTPMEGFNEYYKRNWPVTLAKSDVYERLGMDPEKESRDASTMSSIPRIMHRILVSNITPRKQKHGTLYHQDLILTDKLLLKEPIDLAHQVLKHMENCKKNPSHGLPYPRLVKGILEYLRVYKPTEETLMSTVLSSDNLTKLGLKKSANGEWVKPVVSPVKKEAGEKTTVEESVQKRVDPSAGEDEGIRYELANLSNKIDKLTNVVEQLRKDIEMSPEDMDKYMKRMTDVVKGLKEHIKSVPGVMALQGDAATPQGNLEENV